MSNWVDELGSERFDDKGLEFTTKLFALALEAGDDNDEEFKIDFMRKLDNAVYNVTAIRDIVKEKLNV